MRDGFRSLHGRVTALAQEKGVPPDQIYVLEGFPGKSYSPMVQLYASVNDLPGDRVVTMNRLRDLPPDSLVVMPDDLLGSGNSISRRLKQIRQTFDYPGEFASATLLSSEQGLEFLRGVGERDGRYHHLSESTIVRPMLDPRIAGMAPEEVQKLDVFLRGGYRNNEGLGGLGIFSPVTGAPDNNSNFFQHPLLIERLANGNRKLDFEPDEFEFGVEEPK